MPSVTRSQCAVAIVALLQGCGGAAEPDTSATGDTDVCEPGDWTFEDGECSGCRPRPKCTPKNLGVRSEVGPDAVACEAHEDCADGEFCGAGYCRDAATETVTFCIEEGWFVGPARPDSGTPPDFRTFVYDPQSYGYGPYYSITAPSVPDTCHPVWDHCVEYPLARAGADTVNVYQTKNAALHEEVLDGPLVLGSDGTQRIGRYVDRGCIPFERGVVDEDTEVTVWFSVWYP